MTEAAEKIDSPVDDKAELLAKIPLFSLLDSSERAVLAERIDLERHAKGKVLFNAGDPGESMYMLIEGTVEVWFKNNTGEKIVLETAHAGDFFGEISLLDGGARTAAATVTEDIEALVVDRGDLDEFLKIKPAAAMDLLSATGKRLRETSKLLRHTASRNANEEEIDTRTTVMKVADWIADFSGSLNFLFIHLGIFFVWILLNVPPFVHKVGDNYVASYPAAGFDPFPFGLLTMCVSLEAIVLSVFVLLSQNRQVARDRVRNDIEFDVNLKAEMQIAHMHEKIDHLHEELLKKIDALTKK
jgi:uncharacterized membrane protein